MNILYLTILILVVDIFWLALMKSHWAKIIPAIQGSPLNVRIIPSIVVYLLLALGLYALVFYPERYTKLQKAAILGLVVYGVFDMTNYAVFKNYPLWIAMSDMVWGGILLTAVAYIVMKYL